MPEIKDLVKNLAQKHGKNRESLIPILQGVIQAERYISDEAMTEIARELDMSAAQVYGTATFYSFLDTKPRGKYVIRVCRTISCAMKGKNLINQEIEDLLKIKIGVNFVDNHFFYCIVRIIKYVVDIVRKSVYILPIEGGNQTFIELIQEISSDVVAFRLYIFYGDLQIVS